MTDSSSHAFVMPEEFGGNKLKYEFLIVQFSFLFSLEPPLPCSYLSGNIFLFICETDVKGLCWNYDHPYEDYRTVWPISLCPIFEKPMITVLLKLLYSWIFLFQPLQKLRQKNRRETWVVKDYSAPRIRFIHLVDSFIPHLLSEWLCTGCLVCSIPYGKVSNNWI